jgi:hypothetical protein
MSRLVPVSPDRHGAQLWQRFRSYDFVQDLPLVPIVLGEQEQTAAALPIIAAPIDGGLWPVAVTRLGAKTALVAPNGVWRGAYVPSILRVHPFGAQVHPKGEQAVLLVNEASGLIAPAPQTGDGWEPFFSPDGALTPLLAQVVQFFADRIPAEARTRAAMAALAQAGILTATAPFAGADAAKALPEGARHIDADKLAGLSRTDLSQLHRTGALALAHAMLVSRHHVSFLAQVEAQLDQIAPRPTAPKRREDDALAGFFDAIAAAQLRD